MYEASMHIGELLLFRRVCVFFCIVVYRKERALAYTLIKTDTPGFGISISNYNISFYVQPQSYTVTIMNVTNKVTVPLISVCLTLQSGGKAGCRYGALHCSSHKSLPGKLHQSGLVALYTWNTAVIPTSPAPCWFPLRPFSCCSFHNVFFPSLHPHFHE